MSLPSATPLSCNNANLLTNAIDALNGWCTSEGTMAEPATVWIRTEMLKSGWVPIRFQDNGPGIPSNLLSKIFGQNETEA